MPFWFQNRKPILALAPMADMTDSAFCQTARECGGPDFIVFREMANSEAIVRGNDRTVEMCRFGGVERPIVQQLFGADPSVMAEAVRIIDDRFGPDGFDINMGCPARKIVGNFNGSALMREPSKAAAIVRAVKAATAKPVSVKTRLGWTSPEEILEFSKIIEDAGADLITIHGRTKEQGYSGTADWATIGKAKSRLSIPVILNGDVSGGESARKALDCSGCDGVMVGRCTLGNPWIFAEIAAFIDKRAWEAPDWGERVKIIIRHAERHAVAHPEPAPLVSLRAHLVHYFKGVPGAGAWREKMVRVSEIGELESVLLEK
ncbi:tRNA-dihydrouridine synthase [Candidatus Uhrbacteria bacterium]|nr:tRNA-dihydrouridine synthase [Candidatus Uhrbacteria bacterium]